MDGVEIIFLREKPIGINKRGRRLSKNTGSRKTLKEKIAQREHFISLYMLFALGRGLNNICFE